MWDSNPLAGVIRDLPVFDDGEVMDSNPLAGVIQLFILSRRRVT